MLSIWRKWNEINEGCMYFIAFLLSLNAWNIKPAVLAFGFFMHLSCYYYQKNKKSDFLFVVSLIRIRCIEQDYKKDMRLYIFFIFFFSHYPYNLITIADSTVDENYLSQNSSSIYIYLYQCNKNMTVLKTTTTTIDAIFYNIMSSCSINCCTLTNSTTTRRLHLEKQWAFVFTYIHLEPVKTCQVTMQDSTGMCLGRFCYSDDCNSFMLLANITNNTKIKNGTNTITSQTRSSSSLMLWSSFLNITQTKVSAVTWVPDASQ